MVKLFTVLFSMLIGIASATQTSVTRELTVIYKGSYDGDTIDIEYLGLPTPLNKMRVRIHGIDAPELGVRSRCPAENEMAEKAKALLIASLPSVGSNITIYNFQWDKYGGRILGDLHSVDGQDIKDIMINSTLAYAYNGEGARKDWCNSK
jgi:endonuclease YncB( thermonuclease family)